MQEQKNIRYKVVYPPKQDFDAFSELKSWITLGYDIGTVVTTHGKTAGERGLIMLVGQEIKPEIVRLLEKEGVTIELFDEDS